MFQYAFASDSPNRARLHAVAKQSLLVRTVYSDTGCVASWRDVCLDRVTCVIPVFSFGHIASCVSMGPGPSITLLN